MQNRSYRSTLAVRPIIIWDADGSLTRSRQRPMESACRRWPTMSPSFDQTGRDHGCAHCVVIDDALDMAKAQPWMSLGSTNCGAVPPTSSSAGVLLAISGTPSVIASATAIRTLQSSLSSLALNETSRSPRCPPPGTASGEARVATQETKSLLKAGHQVELLDLATLGGHPPLTPCQIFLQPGSSIPTSGGR